MLTVKQRREARKRGTANAEIALRQLLTTLYDQAIADRDANAANPDRGEDALDFCQGHIERIERQMGQLGLIV